MKRALDRPSTVRSKRSAWTWPAIQKTDHDIIARLLLRAARTVIFSFECRSIYRVAPIGKNTESDFRPVLRCDYMIEREIPMIPAGKTLPTLTNTHKMLSMARYINSRSRRRMPSKFHRCSELSPHEQDTVLFENSIIPDSDDRVFGTFGYPDDIEYTSHCAALFETLFDDPKPSVFSTVPANKTTSRRLHKRPTNPRTSLCWAEMVVFTPQPCRDPLSSRTTRS